MHSERRMILARRAMFVAALVGLFISTYLLITYVSGAPIVCGLVHGCDVVRASKWAYSFGLPRPLFGVAFYAALIALFIWRTMHSHWHARRRYHLSMLFAGAGFIESAFLTFVQWLDIKAFCIWCLGSAAAATLIFILSWLDRSDALEERASLRELTFQFWSLVLAVVVGAGLLFWLMRPAAPAAATQLEPLANTLEQR